MLTASTSRTLSLTTFLASLVCCLWLCLMPINAHAGQKEFTVQELTEEAEQGNQYAQILLGANYEFGQGVPQDYKKAVYYYTLAVEQGLAEAQFCLGNMYGNGQGVPQDYKKAVYYYTLAANQGYAMAQFNLGTMYVFGQGVSQNYIQAYAHAIIAYALNSECHKLKDHLEPKLTPAQKEKAQEIAAQIWEKLPK